MEQENIKFEKFKFDATPYIIAANTFSKQFEEKENVNSDYASSQLNSSISEKLGECSNMNEDLKKIQSETLIIQMELDTLKREEEQLTNSSIDFKEGELFFRNLFLT